MPKTGSGSLIWSREYAGVICLGYYFPLCPFLIPFPFLRIFAYFRPFASFLRVDGWLKSLGTHPHPPPHHLLFDISSLSFQMAFHFMPLSSVALGLPTLSPCLPCSLLPTLVHYIFLSGGGPLRLFAVLLLLVV